MPSSIASSIATWNVNSIRARKDRTLAWLETHQPEVLCLQETKVTDEAFPRADFEALGYRVTTCGQKTYNGVALLSRAEPSDITRRFDDDDAEPEARFLSARFADLRIICVYVPNGQVVGSDKYTYKLAWLGRLQRYLERRCDPDQSLVLCGDLNIAPEDRDVCEPAAWAETVLVRARRSGRLPQAVRLGAGRCLPSPPRRGQTVQLVGLSAARLSEEPGSAHRPYSGDPDPGPALHRGADQPSGAQRQGGVGSRPGPCHLLNEG